MKKTITYFFATIILGVQTAYSQETADSTRTHKIDDVVITADKIVNRGDHQDLYLSDENRNFGTNALEAVSTLPFFRTNLNSTSLTSSDFQDVFILINGVPSTGANLRAYKGDDIKKVEYYNVAPPQYMGYTMGPVANIIVKKRLDRAYTGYFNTSNSVTTGFGTNQADLTYSDSLNMVNLEYLIDYRDIKDIERQTEFDYGNGKSSRYSGKAHYKGQYHNIGATYQRYQGGHLFNAKLYAIINPGQDNENRSGIIQSENLYYQGNGVNNLRSRENTYAADLFYRYLWDNGRMFSINVVNTFGTSYSKSVQSMISDNPANSDYDYELHSDIDNNSYSLIANAAFLSKIWGGTVNLSSRFSYRQLNQKSSGTTYKPHSHSGNLFAGGVWQFGQIGFVPVVSMEIMSQTSQNITYTTVAPDFRLYSEWWGKGKLKGATVQLTLSAGKNAAALDQITESRTYLDPWMISTGNPELKHYWTTMAKLNIGYYDPEGKILVTLGINPSYSHNKIASTITAEEGMVNLKPCNISDYFECNTFLWGDWKPFKWLKLSPYLEHYYSKFNTPLQEVNFNYWRVGGGVTISLLSNKLECVLAVNSPTKEYDGDLLTRGSDQYACIVRYKIGNWSVGAQYNYLGHNDYTLADLPAFRYYKNGNWKPLSYKVAVNATYSFSVGRSRKHARKTIIESDTGNTGLNKFNKAEIK